VELRKSFTVSLVPIPTVKSSTRDFLGHGADDFPRMDQSQYFRPTVKLKRCSIPIVRGLFSQRTFEESCYGSSTH